MSSENSSIPDWPRPQPLTSPRFRPAVVFAREDGSGAGKEAAEPARILIVEDDFLVAWEIEAALSEAGFQIAGVASSAEEAVQLATAKRPTLAVMDIRLNGKRDGIDTAIELFATLGIRSVFASAHQTADARSRAEPASPLGWLPKPYSMPSLIAVVRQALRELGNDK